MPDISKRLAACAALLLFAAPAIGQDGTRISGIVYVLDGSGAPVEYPWPMDRIARHLHASLHDFQTRNFFQSAPVEVKPVQDEVFQELASYSVDIGSRYEMPAVVQIEFKHGVYYFRQDIEQMRHVGPRPLDIEITRRFANRGEQLDLLREFISRETIDQGAASEAIGVLDGLMGDEADFEVHRFLVFVVERILNDIGYLDAETATLVTGLLDTPNFSQLSPADRFQILSDLGEIVSESAPSLEQAVPPDLTYFGLAQWAFTQAGEIAHSEIDEMNAAPVAKMYQHWYGLECQHGVPEDCFYTFLEFAELDLDVSARTTRAFVSDFATALEVESRLVEEPAATEERFRDRTAADPELAEYWGLFAEAVEENDDWKDRVDAAPYLTLTYERARAIREQAATDLAEASP